MSKKIEQEGSNIKGPKVGAPSVALEGFLKSNNLDRTNIFEQDTEKGRFFFAKIVPKTIFVEKELSKIIPDILNNYSWRKSMSSSSYKPGPIVSLPSSNDVVNNTIIYLINIASILLLKMETNTNYFLWGS